MGSISVSTSAPVLLNKKLHRINTPDIFYTSGLTYFDILNPAYLAKVAALNLNGIAINGSISNYYRYNISGDGYAIDVAKIIAEGSDPATYLDGVALATFGHYFITDMAAFKSSLGVACGFTFNIQDGTIGENNSLIDLFDPDERIFGIESVVGQYDIYYNGDGTQYAAAAQPFITAANSHSLGYSVIDGAPTWTSSSRNNNWNTNLLGMDADGVRLYIKPQDHMTFTGNYENDFATMVALYSSGTMKGYIDQCNSLFGLPVTIAQWCINNAGDTTIQNNFMECFNTALMYEMMLKACYSDSTLIRSAYYMSLKKLFSSDNSTTKANYLALQVCSLLFSGTPSVVPLTFAGSGNLRGVGVINGSTVGMLIINPDKQAYTPSVAVDGQTISDFSITQLTAPSLASADVTKNSYSDSILTIPSRSIAFVSFTVPSPPTPPSPAPTPQPITRTSMLYDRLHCAINTLIMSTAKNELYFGCIGKPTAELKYQRVTLLNMRRMFDGCLTDDDLEILSCFFINNYGSLTC